jgi:preprotein translocase subunit YajC
MPFIHEALAQSTPPAPGAGTTATTQAPTGVPMGAPPQPGPLSMIMPFGLMFLVIYFLIIRPQQKKIKQQQELLSKLQHGDEVITNAGIFGKVTGLTDKVVTVEIADNVRIKVLRSQIATINPDLSKIDATKSTELGAR